LQPNALVLVEPEPWIPRCLRDVLRWVPAVLSIISYRRLGFYRSPRLHPALHVARACPAADAAAAGQGAIL